MLKHCFKTVSTLLLGLNLLFITTTLQAEDTKQENRYGKQKVVYHLSSGDPKQQAGALRNIKNHIKAVGAENLDLRVVMYGNGLSLLILPEALEHLPKFKHANATEDMTAKIDSLKSQGVTFNVCNNTVKGRKVDIEKDLHDVETSDIVPSGVAELAHLQAQGFVYIKP